MRVRRMVLATVGAVLLGSAPLVAQDETDSLPPAESPDGEWETDPETAARPAAGPHDGTPYLREVDESTRSPRRGPFWASFGVGAGGEAIAALGAPAPYSPSRVRPTLSLAVGGTVGQQLRLGLEGFAWFNLLGDGNLETVTAVTLGGRLYPIASSGLYLRAGAGFGRYGQDLSDDYCGCSSTLVSDYGLAWVVGGGFELPVGRGLWLGPNLEMVRMNVNGSGGYRERILNFGLTITYDGK